MLYLTGQIGDKAFNEESVSPQFLLELFKDSIPNPLNGGMVEFRLSERHVKTDEFNQKWASAALQLPCRFNGTAMVNGQIINITLQYATNRQVTADGKIKYTPTRLLGFNGEALAFTKDDIQSMDAYVYYALHTLNVKSPFHVLGNRYDYTIYDRAKESKERTDMLKLVNEIQRQLFSTDFELLRIKAGGLSYRVPGGATVSGFGFGLSQDDLIDQLATMLKRDTTYFIHAWNDQGNMLKGMVQYALDEGHIVTGIGPAGGPSYSWSQPIGGATIVDCGRGQDGPMALVSAFVNDSNLMKVLNDTLNTRRVAAVEVAVKELEMPEMAPLTAEAWKEADCSQVVELALSKEVIYFDRSSAKLILRTPGAEDEVIFDYKGTDSEWKPVFIKNLKSPSYFGPKKKIVAVLTAAPIQKEENLD